jgi:hypothetical protein
MSSLLCRCGNQIGLELIPNPNEWIAISDEEYDTYSGMIDSEALYKAMKSIYKCSKCGRLWAFWEGASSAPQSYLPEAP